MEELKGLDWIDSFGNWQHNERSMVQTDIEVLSRIFTKIGLTDFSIETKFKIESRRQDDGEAKIIFSDARAGHTDRIEQLKSRVHPSGKAYDSHQEQE